MATFQEIFYLKFFLQLLSLYTHTHTHTHTGSTPSSIAVILFSCGNSELHNYDCQKNLYLL